LANIIKGDTSAIQIDYARLNELYPGKYGNDSQGNPVVAIGNNQHGDLSILWSYALTYAEYIALIPNYNFVLMPWEVTIPLVRTTDGAKIEIPMLMYYSGNTVFQ
jgi:hypothetical protein